MNTLYQSPDSDKFEEAKNLFLLAVDSIQNEHFEKAEQYLFSSLNLMPDRLSTFINLSTVLIKLEKLEKAEEVLSKAIALYPEDATLYSNQGQLFSKYKNWQMALDCYNKSITLKNDYAEVYSNRGIVLFELRHLEKAISSYDKAIELKSNYPEAYANRGIVFKELKKFDQALLSYGRAIELNPDYAEAHYNLGILLVEIRRFDEAFQSYDRAIEIKPAYADAHWNKSLCLLICGDFKNGWLLHEWRWKTANQKSYRQFPQPLWLGSESLVDKTILLHAEQGLGDTIQFCRYVTLVKQLGAKVLLEVPRALITLVRDLEGVDEIIESGAALPAFDYHCPLLSLPLAFKSDLHTVPFPQSYLKINPFKFNYWQNCLSHIKGLKVGLVWSGGFRANQSELWSLNRKRNVSLDVLSQKLQDVNVNFFSLQKGDPAESEIRNHELEYWPNGNFFNYADQLIDFKDTAALIANLDLVIAVDTSTAHLAGALGKKTWLLNRFDSCWRWLLDRDDTPWYESVKIYRQGEDRAWTSVLDRVRNDLISFSNI